MQKPSRFVTNLFLVVFLGGILLMGRLLFQVITPIVLALVLVSIFDPIHNRLLRRMNGNRTAASLSTTLVVFLVVIVPIALFASALSGQAYDLYQTTRDTQFLHTMNHFVSGDSAIAVQLRGLATSFGIDISPEKLTDWYATVAKAVGLFIYEKIGGLASNAAGILLDFTLILILLSAFFSKGNELKEYLLDLSPLPDEQENRLIERFSASAKAVFLGNGIASLVQGFFGGVGFVIFGLGSGALSGAAIAFFAFLPVLGASIVVVPAIGYLMIQGRYGAALGFFIYNGVYIAIFEYGLKTKLVGGSLNAVLVFIGIVGGLTLFGMLGLFYGPLVITMFLTLAEIYKEDYRDGLMHTEDGVPPSQRSIVNDKSAAIRTEDV